jgi:hypothetical protein
MTDTALLWTITHAQRSLVDLDSFSEEMVAVMPGTLCCQVPATRIKPDGSVVIRRFNKKGTAFRIFDDDGDLYYRGRYHGDPNGSGAFAPLDWAQGEAGATRIDYRQPDGTWRTL